MLHFTSVEKFEREYSGRPIVLIGAGRRAQRVINEHSWNIKYAVDNNTDAIGKTLGEKKIDVYGWAYLKNHYQENDILLITPFLEYDELKKQLEKDFENADIFVLTFMESLQWDADRIRQSNVPFKITKGTSPKIPKTIHYFWFSGDEYPDKVKRCIDSWHKYCPDYEFKLWSLDNYKTDNVFCNEALSKRVWAFASDFGRCDVLYRYGGIYLDTDVELIKPLDELLYDDGFFCFESASGVDPGSGMGSVKGNPIFAEICNQYEGIHFINEDGSYNKANILEQYTSVLERHGLKRTGYYQNINNIAVYPSLVFSPYSYMTGIDSRYERTYGVHHWVSAWITEEDRRMLEERKETISSYVDKHGGINSFI